MTAPPMPTHLSRGVVSRQAVADQVRMEHADSTRSYVYDDGGRTFVGTVDRPLNRVLWSWTCRWCLESEGRHVLASGAAVALAVHARRCVAERMGGAA